VIGRDIRPIGKALVAGASLTWRLHLQATAPGWIHFAMSAPLLDTARARHELGWAPAIDARATLHELLAGLHARTDFPTPPLQRSGPTEALRGSA
jgi:UDP-glucose 4-epimerase